jgi:hypothetical protein
MNRITCGMAEWFDKLATILLVAKRLECGVSLLPL